MPWGIMSPQEVLVAAAGEAIHLMFDTARPPWGDFDRGRGFEGLGIDLGGKLLVIHGRCWRERERSHEKGRREAEPRFPFIGVAQNRNMLCRRSVF